MIEEFVQLTRYSYLIEQFIRRDVVTWYKRSTLGAAWTLLNPLGMMLVVLIAFSTIFGSTRSYAAYLLSGLIVWNFFTQATTGAMRELAWGGPLLSHIYLPRATFAISSTGTGLVNLVLALIPLGIVMAVTRTAVHPALLLLPLAVALLALFALGVGLLVSALAVYFPDVTEIYQVLLLAWMYLTPVIYPESIIPPAYRWWLLNLNPMSHLLRLFRTTIMYGNWPSAAELALDTIIAIIIFAIGWTTFTGKADEFIYRI